MKNSKFVDEQTKKEILEYQIEELKRRYPNNLDYKQIREILSKGIEKCFEEKTPIDWEEMDEIEYNMARKRGAVTVLSGRTKKIKVSMVQILEKEGALLTNEDALRFYKNWSKLPKLLRLGKVSYNLLEKYLLEKDILGKDN